MSERPRGRNQLGGPILSAPSAGADPELRPCKVNAHPNMQHRDQRASPHRRSRPHAGGLR
eukprot:scaffold34347_cov118-Isochrysis_galbana.AAC.4